MNPILNEIAFRPAYNDKGGCSWSRKEFYNQPGVYVIAYRGEIAYIGRSGSCVYRACYRHFAKWLKTYVTRGGNFDVWFDREFSEVWMHKVEDKQDSIIIEKALVCDLKPEYNRENWGLLRSKPINTQFRKPSEEAFSEDYDLLSLYEEDYHLKQDLQ